MTQTKFFRWTLLLCLSGATSPLAAQGVGEKAKKVEQMQVLKTDGKVPVSYTHLTLPTIA